MCGALLTVIMTVPVASMEEGSSAFKISTGNPTGKILLRRPRRRWEDNIRKYLKYIGAKMSLWIIGELFKMRHWTSRFHKS